MQLRNTAFSFYTYNPSKAKLNSQLTIEPLQPGTSALNTLLESVKEDAMLQELLARNQIAWTTPQSTQASQGQRETRAPSWFDRTTGFTRDIAIRVALPRFFPWTPTPLKMQLGPVTEEQFKALRIARSMRSQNEQPIHMHLEMAPWEVRQVVLHIERPRENQAYAFAVRHTKVAPNSPLIGDLSIAFVPGYDQNAAN